MRTQTKKVDWYYFLALLLSFTASPPLNAAVIVSWKLESWLPLYIGVLATIAYYHAGQYIYADLSVRTAIDGQWSIYELDRDFLLEEKKATEFIAPSVIGMIGQERIDHMFVVVATPRSPAVRPLHEYRAYMQPSGLPVIIAGQRPGQMGSGQQFGLLHELGHVGLPGTYHKLNTQNAWFRLQFIYGPLLLLVEPQMFSFVFCLCVWHWWEETRYDFTEMAADLFAIDRLREIVPPEVCEMVLQLHRNNLQRQLAGLDQGLAGLRPSVRRKRRELKSRLKAYEMGKDPVEKGAIRTSWSKYSDHLQKKIVFQAGIPVFLGYAAVFFRPRLPDLDSAIFISMVTLFILFAAYWRTSSMVREGTKLLTIVHYYASGGRECLNQAAEFLAKTSSKRVGGQGGMA